jgi:hypothetical protein
MRKIKIELKTFVASNSLFKESSNKQIKYVKIYFILIFPSKAIGENKQKNKNENLLNVFFFYSFLKTSISLN